VLLLFVFVEEMPLIATKVTERRSVTPQVLNLP
jgi:hypothetical protein